VIGDDIKAVSKKAEKITDVESYLFNLKVSRP
jgi:hypothetical protein